MKPFTYLLVNLLAVVICVIYSFHPRIRFNRHFGAFIKASLLVAIPFLIWDIEFTRRGIWWFDHSFTLGIAVFGLPLEEWLFFICIPFSCVFTYFCLDKFVNLKRFRTAGRILVGIYILVCLVFALMFYDRAYTALTAIATLLCLAWLMLGAKVNWLEEATVVYLVLFPGFFAVNGVLTGTGLPSPVVNYNNLETLGIRMGTIPVEDLIYGYTLFLLNVYLFKKFTPGAVSFPKGRRESTQHT